MNIPNVIATLVELNSEFGGPGGIRTPDLLNAMPAPDRPRECARIVLVFNPDSCAR